MSVIIQPAENYENHRPRIRAQIEHGQIQLALGHLIQLAKTLPSTPKMLDDMASCYWCLGDHETALKLTQMVAEDLPSSALAWGKLGAMAVSVGAMDQAQVAFERSLKIDINQANALAALNKIVPFKKAGKHARALLKISKSKRAGPAERAAAHNALGWIEHSEGNAKAAFYQWGKAKAFSPGRFDAAAIGGHVDQQSLRYTPDASRGAQPEARVVFVVGMPRSGTTLVESILSMHPQVGTIGESTALRDVLAQCRTNNRNDPWAWVDTLDVADAAELGGQYLARCAQSTPSKLPEVIVDKTALNIFEIGFARRILPNARFVYLSRHPLDVGLSCYATNFSSAQSFSRSLQSIGQMIDAVYRSAKDYQDKLGRAFRWQSYTGLVNCPDDEVRALLDHLQLPWNPDCLSPERRTGIVRTASVTQVRREINTKATGKWKRYEKELVPMVQSLGGWDWIDAWAAEDAGLQYHSPGLISA